MGNHHAQEMFDLVDEHGNVIGLAPRRLCHGNPVLRHRTTHVVVRSSDGRILLQRRSADKDVQPGRWDTAVGGHLAHGETFEQAARREMAEEIGLTDGPEPQPLFDMAIANDIESELTRVFTVVSDGPFTPQPEEVDELRLWTAEELAAAIGTGQLTPYLEHELSLLLPRLQNL